MLTAQQLYEIIAHKDDTEIGADGQPKNRAAKALYSLVDHYREHPATAENMDELLFSAALNDMVERAERVVKKGASEADFKTILSEDVGKFNATFDKLPREVREQGPVREAFDVILPEQNPDKLAYDREVKSLTEELLRQHDSLVRLRAGTHPAQTGPAPLTQEELETRKKEAEQRINEAFTALLAMDDLQKASGWSSALDPEQRKKAADKLALSPSAMMALGGVREVARDPAEVADLLRQLGRTELQAQIAPAAEAVEKEKQKAAAQVFEEETRLLAEETLRSFTAVRQLIDGKHPAFRDKRMSAEDRQEMLERNTENLRASIATLAAMNEFGKAGDFVSATDPQKLEKAADAVMAKKGGGLDLAMETLTSRAGTPDLAAVFMNSNLRNLSNLIVDVQKSEEQKTKAAFQEEYDALLGQAVRRREELDRLRKDGPGEQQGNAYAGSRDELKAGLAALIAMDNFRRKGKYAVLNDPGRLEAETDRILRSKRLETAMESLAPGKGGGKTLTEVFRDLNRKTLSQKLAALETVPEKQEQKPEEPVNEKTEPEKAAEAAAEETGPEIVQETKEKPEEPVDEKPEPEKTEEVKAEETGPSKEPVFPEEPLRKSSPEHPRWRTVPEEPQRNSVQAEGKGAAGQYSPDCPVMRFQAKLQELREDIKMSTVSPLYELDVTQCRVGLARLFALRDMGKTDPLSPVTDDQVKARIHHIYHTKGNPEFKLYQDIDKKILSGDTRVFKRVVGAITGEESSKEFAQTVSKASWIKLQNVKEQKAPGLSR